VETLELIRHKIRKPARYEGLEYFPEGYKEPREGDLKFVLVYPDTYEIGMSNTGLRIIYSLLARKEGIYVDLAFTPWKDMESALRETEEPLTSRHGNIPLAQFDVVGFSLQYELNYTNILTVLDLAGIPFRANQRTEAHPLVIGGGPCASHAEPVAPFFDALVIGDGEESLPRLLDTIQAKQAAGLDRTEQLTGLDELPGVYAPDLHPSTPSTVTNWQCLPDVTISKQAVRDLDEFLPFNAFPVPAVETVFDRVSLELARGCHQGCRFCEAGFTYRPTRERAPAALLQWAQESLDQSGFTELSLASLSSADYTHLLSLVRDMRVLAGQRQARIAVSSLRAYGVPDEVLKALTSERMSSLTLAPEAGSQRLRNLINKNITRDQILESVSRIVARGIKRLKLYFMIGLPTETTEDLDELITLVRDCYEIVRRRFKGKAGVVASISMFVPRPHTPFQWEPMATREELQERLDYLRGRLFNKGISFKWHNPDMSWLEAVVTRGDRRLADVIETAWQNGVRFDSWDEEFAIDTWEKALLEHGIDGNIFLSGSSLDSALPWSHINVGVDEKYLLRERKRAFEGALTVPCTPFSPSEVCYRCGAECTTSPIPPQDQSTVSEEAQIPEPAQHPPAEPVQDLSEHRYRLHYQKIGAGILTGHLDLLRHLTLAMRRAGFTLARSHGFNPRPKFSFPPPMPLGHYGLAEPADFFTLGPLPEDALAQLQTAMVPGLDITDLIELKRDAPKVSKVSGAQYLLAVADSSTDSVNWLEQIAALGLEHILEVSPAGAIPSDLPPAPGIVLAITWATGSAPRIDRTLSEALTGLDFAWVARIGFI
jgi:radical SAM family uncharacterized protein